MRGLILVLLSNVCYLAVNVNFGGYLVVTARYLMVTAGYWWLLLVTGGYYSLPLVTARSHF